MEEFILTF